MEHLKQALLAWRMEQAHQRGVEVFQILQMGTVEAICTNKPQAISELLQIKGIGPQKAATFGPFILQLVQEHAQINNVKPKISMKMAQHSQPVTSQDLFSADEAYPTEQGKQRVRVGEYLDYLNQVLPKTADVKIVGEISSGKMYPSGYYFTLKDKLDESALNCYLPPQTYRGLGMPLEDGMEVAVEGMPKIVKRNGRFSLTVENLELVGEGALKKSYELLKARFETEGLFTRKRALPEFIQKVGIITSKAGAVIHDFRSNLPALSFKLYLRDVRVEGASSSQMIAGAVEFFNHKLPDLDCLIIMRGGGSLEDLQSFNNEAVVRAVFASKIPTVVAVGHDQDVPLAQLAADLMVSTPTAAANAISGSWIRLAEYLPNLENRLLNNSLMLLTNHKSRLAMAVTTIIHKSQTLLSLGDFWAARLSGLIQEKLRRTRQLDEQLPDTYSRLCNSMAQTLNQTQHNLNAAETLLRQTDPKRQLSLGFSLTRASSGKIIRSIRDVQVNDAILSEVADGLIKSKVAHTRH